MNDEQVIREAVELADGFEMSDDEMSGDAEFEWVSYYVDGKVVWSEAIEDLTQYTLDALAAQLVRQVDALPVGKFPHDAPSAVYQTPHEVQVWSGKQIAAIATKGDRTMNTLRAIVESGVLRGRLHAEGLKI